MPGTIAKPENISRFGKKGERVSTNVQLGLHRYGLILGKTLGCGAYAKVKSAHSIQMNQQVAVKIIQRKGAPKDLLCKFLPREIDILRKVKNENIIKLFEVIFTDGHTYLIMEMAENGDLLDYINARKYLHEGLAQRFLNEMVGALSACHKLGIVHRDLKCENILLDSKYCIKISDFGFATMYSGKPLETYCGSFAYAAPEVILGHPYNGEKSDTWSIGVILYAMTVGRLPFKDSDIKTLLAEIGTCLIFPTRLSCECASLIRSILTYNTSERLTLSEILEHSWTNKVFEKIPHPSEKPATTRYKKQTANDSDKPATEKNKAPESIQPSGEEEKAVPGYDKAKEAFESPACAATAV